jgi:drug/metabolite transporter (DMT)-like permease
MSTTQRHQNLVGIGWMLAAVAVLTVLDAAMKWLTPHYPPLQITALRGLTSLPILVAWVALSGGFRQVRSQRWKLHLLRGALSVLMLTCFIYTVGKMPLADAYAIFFVSPLLITALSVPLLGERVDARRWAAIGVGLLGMLVVLRPTGEGTFTLAGVAAITAAVCYSLSAITVRVLGRTDSTAAMVFWFIILLSTSATLLAAPGWVPVQRDHWPALLTVGCSGAFGQFAITEAFRRGEASVIAPFEYSALAWGLGLDWLLWSTRPDLGMLGGAAIVIAAGLYLIHRERAVGGETVASEPVATRIDVA